MHSPDLDSVIKYLRKKYKNWSNDKIQGKANEIFKNYLDVNKESIGKSKIKKMQQIEEDLDLENLQWWLMWKAGEI
jgi:hypothetical protein